MYGASKAGRVGSPRCGSGSANVGVSSAESDSMPGNELRSGGSVSPGRLAHSGSETGPDDGFECWLIAGDGRGSVGAMGACGSADGVGWTSPGGALDGAGDAGTGCPAGGWPAVLGDGGGGGGGDSASTVGSSTGSTAGGEYDSGAAGGVVGTALVGTELVGTALVGTALVGTALVGTEASAGACSGASNTSWVHCCPSQRRRRALSAGSGYHPGGITEVPSATLTRQLPSITCRRLV